jgi:regulator of nucleoside diphosphate kinase
MFTQKGEWIVITDTDMKKLSRLVRSASQLSLLRDGPQLELLQQTLDSAEVRPSRRVPKSIIRIHSRSRVRDLNSQQQGIYVVVLPDEADATRGLISVLTPLGMALLGHRKGDVIQAKAPGGTRRLRVQRVWQQDHKERPVSSRSQSQEQAGSVLQDSRAA